MRSSSIVATHAGTGDDEVGRHGSHITHRARLSTIAARSSTVVNGFTMHQRSTVSSPHADGVTNDVAATQLVVAPPLVVGGGPARVAGTARSTARARSPVRGARRRAPGRHPARVTRQRRLDRVGVGVGAVCGEAEPERQAAGAAGEVVGVVDGVPLVDVVGRRRAARRGTRRAGCGRAGRSPDRGTRSAHESNGANSHLCGIDDEAVGPLDAVVAGGGSTGRSARPRRRHRRRGATCRAARPPRPRRAGRRRHRRSWCRPSRRRRTTRARSTVGELGERAVERRTR